MSNVEKPEEATQQVEKASDGGEDHVKPTTNVDDVHNDEAIKVLAAYTGDTVWSPDEERKLRRKIDWRIMPVLCLTYGLQYYDKAMLSQAVSLFLNPGTGRTGD